MLVPIVHQTEVAHRFLDAVRDHEGIVGACVTGDGIVAYVRTENDAVQGDFGGIPVTSRVVGEVQVSEQLLPERIE